MITIYDISGVERLSVLETEPAVYYRMLMGKHHVFLSFRTTEYVPVSTGDYIELEGKRFTLYTPQKPREISEGEYFYELYFGAPEMSFLNFVLFYAGDSKWVLTSNAATFMQVVLENIIRYTGDSGWTLGTVTASETKTIQFDGENGFDGLTLIAETFESEWYVEGKVLYLTKCEFGTEVELKQGEAITEKEASESSDEYITRLYAFGSTRNIPEDYRTTESVSGKVVKRLKLPAGTPYIDAWTNMQPHEVVEGVRIFEEIYPRQVCTVTEVRTETRTVEEVEITVYILKYSGLTFSEDYLITDPLSLVFQSGNLNGRDFELVFLPDTNEFEIINETDGVTLPNPDIAPSVGDLFVLYNFNIQLVSDQYLTNAEQELAAEATAWLSYKNLDVSVYTCPTNPVYCETNGIDLAVGQKVSLVGQMFPNGARSSRIYGFEKKLHNKFECKYTVGDSSKYSRIAALEKNVKAIEYTEKAIIGSGTGAYLITQYDTTPPSDFNAFSALRAKLEHVSKKNNDTVQGLLSFMKGMKSANFAPGFLGQGFSIQPMKDALGNILPSWEATFEYLNVTKKATFKEIVIEQLSHVGGALLLSPAAIKCTAVENILDTDGVTVKAYRCFFDNSEVPNRFDLADQALCQDFSLTGSKRYWRYVIGIGEDYIDLSATDCEVGSDIPEPEDAIIQLGNRADPARQAAILLTSYGLGGPSFQMVTNVGVLFEGETNPYTLENREEIRIKPNDSLFTGTVVIAGSDGKKYKVPRDRGAWTPGTIALFYDRYSYNGSLWLCLAIPSTDLEPNEQNEIAWLKQVAKGSDGSAGNYTSYVFIESDTQPATPTGTSPVPAGWLDAPTGVGNWWMSMATVNAVNNQAGAWSTPIQVTGEDGSVFPYRYAKNTSKTEYPAIVRTDVEPAGWSTTPPALEPGEYLWMTQAEVRLKTVGSTGNVFDITFDDTFYTEAVAQRTATLLSNWTEPIRISGEAGQDGLDGKSIEFIFIRTTTQVTPDTPESVNEDDYVPTNWTDDQTGVDNIYQFEYASKRVRSITGVWGDFSVPALWAKYSFDGQDGRDGKDYEYIFSRTSAAVAPTRTSTSQDDDFVPLGWTDDPKGTDAANVYEWVCKRIKVNGVWSEFSSPALWSKWSRDGEDGDPGADAIEASLSNAQHNIPTDFNGNNGNFTGAACTMYIYKGIVDDSANWTVEIVKSAGVTGSLSGKTYSVTGLSTDNGYVDFTASRAGYASITKRMTLAKSKTGEPGVTPTAYWLVTPPSVARSSAGVYTPASFTVYSYKSVSATPELHPGQFVISETEDGSTYVVKYTSSANESGKAYTPSSANVKSFKVTLRKSVTDSTVLDDQVIPVVMQGANGADGISYMLSANANVVTKTVALSTVTYTPSTLTFNPRKRVGSAVPVAPSDCSLRIQGWNGTGWVYISNIASATELTYSVSVSSTYTQYRAQLYLSAVMVQELVINVVEDAKSGKDALAFAFGGFSSFEEYMLSAISKESLFAGGFIRTVLIEVEALFAKALQISTIADLVGTQFDANMVTVTQQKGMTFPAIINGTDTNLNITPQPLPELATFLSASSLSGVNYLTAFANEVWSSSGGPQYGEKTKISPSYQTIPAGVNSLKWNSIAMTATFTVPSGGSGDPDRKGGLWISLYAHFYNGSTYLGRQFMGTVGGMGTTRTYNLSGSISAGQCSVPTNANRVYLYAQFACDVRYITQTAPDCTLNFTALPSLAYFASSTGVYKTQVAPDGVAVARDASNYIHIKAGNNKMLLSFMGDIDSNSIAQKLLTMNIAASGLIVNIGGYMKKAGFSVGSSVTKVSTGVWRIQHDIYSNYGLGPSSYTVHPTAANAGYDIPAYMYVSASDKTSYNWTEVRAMNHQGTLVDTEFYLTFMRI